VRGGARRVRSQLSVMISAACHAETRGDRCLATACSRRRPTRPTVPLGGSRFSTAHAKVEVGSTPFLAHGKPCVIMAARGSLSAGRRLVHQRHGRHTLRALALMLVSLALVSSACGARTALGLLDEVRADAGGAASADSGCEPPSCAPGGLGMTNCGASMECCCLSLEVNGGTFFRSYDDVDPYDGGFKLSPDGAATGLAYPATVSDFRLDKYLVTVGRFRQFVDAWSGGNGYVPPAGSGKHAYLNAGKGLANSADPGTYETGWIESDDSMVAPTNENLNCMYGTWTNSPGQNENLPINCPNWYEAYAFCIWDGGFLPTDAEWGYAAAGGSEQRLYPWGSTSPGSENMYAIYDCYYPEGTAGGGCEKMPGHPAPVGTATLGVGLWGQLDMGGEFEIWVLDWYAQDTDPCIDWADLTSTSDSGYAADRVTRSGGFASPLPTILAGSASLGPLTDRLPAPPALHGFNFGFRCARRP
jgi:formylglycine-generating enzyme